MWIFEIIFPLLLSYGLASHFQFSQIAFGLSSLFIFIFTIFLLGYSLGTASVLLEIQIPSGFNIDLIGCFLGTLVLFAWCGTWLFFRWFRYGDWRPQFDYES